MLYGPKGLSVLIFLTPLATILKEEGEALVSDGNPLADIFSTVKPAGFNVTDESITEAAMFSQRSKFSSSLTISNLYVSHGAFVWCLNMRREEIWQVILVLTRGDWCVAFHGYLHY